ncbi:MAG TPA: hypothetical protein VN033_12095 [Vulgatibacter sp.]|nr:hypothetical protein [Vulgatibacter sp.]
MTLSVRVGDKLESGAFGEGASLFGVVEGESGEPGGNPFEDNKNDRDYTTYIEFLFLGQCAAMEVKEEGRTWLVVESLGRVHVYGSTEALPVSPTTFGLADWVQVMADTFPDPMPHSPTMRPQP